MIGRQLILIKRELWEHRSIFITPGAIGIIVTLAVLTMLMFASGFAKELDVVIFGAQNVAGDAERRAALTGFFLGTSWIFFVALAILTVEVRKLLARIGPPVAEGSGGAIDG